MCITLLSRVPSAACATLTRGSKIRRRHRSCRTLAPRGPPGTAWYTPSRRGSKKLPSVASLSLDDASAAADALYAFRFFCATQAASRTGLEGPLLTLH